MNTNTANSLHNPFHNRFNDPVTRRLDEMQSDAYVALLRERNNNTINSEPAASEENKGSTSQHTQGGR